MDETTVSILLNGKDNPALVPSGYGKILQYVAPLLMDMGYDVRLHCAVGHQHGTIDWEEPHSKRLLQIWSGGSGAYGEDITQLHLNRLTQETKKPGVSLFIGDVIALNQLPQMCRDGQLAGAAWGAVDWEHPTPRYIADKFSAFNHVWSMSKHGQRVLEEGGVRNQLPAVWFGVNPEIWKPEDRSNYPKIMESMGFQEDTFNVFSCFANQYQRKGEYEMFMALAEFHRRHPEAKVRFFAMTQVRRDWDLVALAETLGIRDIVRFSDDYTHVMSEYREEDMAKMMNAADCVLSIGYEGFGFQTIEAQALNKPVIGFQAAATPELLKAGIMVPPAKDYMQPSLIRRFLPDETGVVTALEEIWRTKDDKKRWSHGRPWVLDNLTWAHTAKGLKANMRRLEQTITDQGLSGPAPPGALALERAKHQRTITPKGG